MERTVLQKQNPRFVLFFTSAAIAVVAGILHSYLLRWVNDDAFISFRYAKNLVDGLGLVFNAGERVEGYTNFLWTMLIALGMKVGFDPVSFSMVLGILFHASTIMLFIYASWYLQRRHGATTVVPVTALALCVHRDFNVYATSGLETSFFTFIVSLAFLSLIVRTSNKGSVVTGILLSVAMMIRPDGVLFLVATIVFLLLTVEDRWTRCSFLVLPVIFLYVPYWLWRYSYYGYPFPNTFYAKSVDLPYYAQGLNYVLLYWRTYYVHILLPILLFVGMRKENSQRETASLLQSLRPTAALDSPGPRAVLLALLFSCIWTLYVIRIGGDFMFARFLIPITPLLFFMCEVLLTQYLRPILSHVLVVLLVLATFARFDQFEKSPARDGISDEWKFYPPESLEWARRTGETLRKYFQHLPVNVAFGGMMAQVVYYAEPAVAIEGATGLTDTVIAHLSLETRGRPGHEKSAPTDYLVKRRVQFLLWVNEPSREYPAITDIAFDGVRLRMFLYDENLMENFTKYPEVRFTHMPTYLDSYLTTLDSVPRQKMIRDYSFLKTYYFDPNNDRSREQAFLSRLNQTGIASSK